VEEAEISVEVEEVIGKLFTKTKTARPARA